MRVHMTLMARRALCLLPPLPIAQLESSVFGPPRPASDSVDYQENPGMPVGSRPPAADRKPQTANSNCYVNWNHLLQPVDHVTFCNPPPCASVFLAMTLCRRECHVEANSLRCLPCTRPASKSPKDLQFARRGTQRSWWSRARAPWRAFHCQRIAWSP